MLPDKFIRSVGILCGLLLGGPFFRKVLIYAFVALVPMLFRVRQPFISLAKSDITAGASTTLAFLLMVTVSLPFGLMGATLGVIAKKMIATFVKNVDWIEDLSKRGINRGRPTGLRSSS